MSLPIYDDPSTPLVTAEVGQQRLAADRASAGFDSLYKMVDSLFAAHSTQPQIVWQRRTAERMDQIQDEQSRPRRPDELAERMPSRPALIDPPAVPRAIDVTAPAAGTPHAAVVAVAGMTARVGVDVQGAAADPGRGQQNPVQFEY